MDNENKKPIIKSRASMMKLETREVIRDFIHYETQSNLTVASLLGGLCWVIYFSFNTFLTDSKTADPKNILEKNKCYSSVPKGKSVTH